MCVFISKDNKIIHSHLNHMLNSYYFSTGYSVYAYDSQGQLIDKKTGNDYTKETEWINIIVMKIINFIKEDNLRDKDSILLEIEDNIFTIVAPVFSHNKLIMFLLLEPFFITHLSTCDKKQLYEKSFKDKFISISYNDFKSIVHIHKDRVNYLGQLFYHLMSNSIYIGQQHFKPKNKMENTIWGKTLSIDSFNYTDGFINLPIAEQICDYLVIKDIDSALRTYQLIQTFLKAPSSNHCPLRILKYQLVSLITIIQHHLTENFKEIRSIFYNIANDCILRLDSYSTYSDLFQYGEIIITDFYKIIKEHDALDLSPNIRQALEYIHTNYMRNIHLSDIAKSIPMNETYLSAQFKKQIRVSLKQYLNEYRIKQATILIKNTKYNITDIALMVGFDSTNYFSTVFKKYTLISPSEYVKKYRRKIC